MGLRSSTLRRSRAAALLLALIGVYGVMSYVVAQRTRRSGSGWRWAQPEARWCVWCWERGLRIVAAGTGLGLAAAHAGALEVIDHHQVLEDQWR